MNNCPSCAGETAFQLIPYIWPEIGWAHWTPPAVAIYVHNGLLRIPWAAERAAREWNTAQGRFYLEQDDVSLPTIDLRDYDNADISGPLQDYSNAEFWRKYGGASLIYNASGERIGAGGGDKRTARARVWVNYDNLGAPSAPKDSWANLSTEQQNAVDAIVHEIGHTLGLGDVASDNGWRVMNYSVLYQPGPSGPYPADVVSVLHAYGGLDWWPKTEEWLTGPPGIRLWLWDTTFRVWAKWDSSAPEFVNSLRALRPGDRLQCFSDVDAQVQVGRHTVRFFPGATTITWPPP